MKKIIKKCVIILIIVVGIFAIYVTEESVRLNKVSGSKPLIIIDQTKCSPSCADVGNEITLEYYGLGYKLSIRYYHSMDSSVDNDIYKITGGEFRLFNKFLIWAWVE